MCILSSGNKEWLDLNRVLKCWQCDLQAQVVLCVIRFCPAYTWASLKSKRNLELLPLSLGFIKLLYALVQLAVPAKSSKIFYVPGHKLGWDGSTVWWGLHNNHPAYTWLNALLLIPHFHKQNLHPVLFPLSALKRIPPITCHKQKSLSRQYRIPQDVTQWSKIISEMRLCISPLPSASHHWKMKWVPGMSISAVI